MNCGLWWGTLKALLVSFRRLTTSRSSCACCRHPDIVDSLLDAKWLTPFGVEIRYPGDFPETLPGDESRAVELAGRAREADLSGG